MWRSWGSLMHSVNTGETAFDHLYEKDAWTYFKENDANSSLFNKFMEELSTADARAAVEAFDFEGQDRCGRGWWSGCVTHSHCEALFHGPRRTVQSAACHRRDSNREQYLRQTNFDFVPLLHGRSHGFAISRAMLNILAIAAPICPVRVAFAVWGAKERNAELWIMCR